MTQADKELLLKDLCARIPYGVKGIIKGGDVVTTPLKWYAEQTLELSIGYMVVKHGWRPYLFPLSSMTEELKNFIRWKLTTPKYDSFDEESLEDLFHNNIQVVNFCYEHHLDISGLIEKGLAIDATDKNIY